jgi:hypothetical protein
MKLRLVLIGAILLPGLLASPGLAAPQPAAPAENACIVLVSDESGSMADNDPTFLRNTAAKLFFMVLDDGDRVGIVRFSSRATRLTPGLVTLNRPEDKQALSDLLSNTPPDGYTDIRAALVEAAALLQNAACDAPYIVLLSDGKPELPGGLPGDYESQTLALARQLNAPILGIALTAGGESGLLYRLAEVTGGAVIPARTASDLLDAYLEAVARLKDRTVLGSGFTHSPGTASLPLEVGLAQYISRVTYIVSKPEGVSVTFMAPGNVPLRPADPRLAFAYTADPRFTVYTVDTPAPGNWGFTFTGPGEVQVRAILRSRLRVIVSQPQAYHPLGLPMPLAVSLVEEERDGTLTTLIGQASFSAFVVRPDGTQDALDQLYDDGTHGDARAGDGVFTQAYVKTDLAGEYLITVTGYKGLIPVTRSRRVLVVPFPQITVLSPTAHRFEFRGEPLIIAMRLEGGDPPALDTGTFVARVTDPDGVTQVIPLAPSGETFTAEFSPVRHGPHTIEFLPQDATYKGVPYTLAVRRAVEVLLIPTISLIQSHLNLGAVESGELARGLAMKVSLVSSSPQAEAIGWDLVGVPGLVIASTTPAQVPGGESAVYLTIKGDLQPGVYTATLVLSVRDGVDLPQRQALVTLTVYQPSLAVQPERLDLGAIWVDQVQRGHQFTLLVTSHSFKDEPLTLGWEGTEGVQIQAARTITIPAQQSLEVSIRIWSESLSEGAYAGQVRLKSREGVMVTPQAINVTFTVVPVPWCARWCPLLIGLGGALLIIGVVAAGYLSSRPRPWGTLKGVKAPTGQYLPSPISIASAAGFLHAGKVVIGSGARAQIRLQDGKVRPAHAVIKVARQTQPERVGKPPKVVQVEKRVNVVENLSDGLVKVNNVSVPKGQQSVPLRSGMHITIGDYELEYSE